MRLAVRPPAALWLHARGVRQAQHPWRTTPGTLRTTPGTLRTTSCLHGWGPKWHLGIHTE